MVLVIGWRDCVGDWHGGRVQFCNRGIPLGLEFWSTGAINLLAFSRFIEFSPSLWLVLMVESPNLACVLSSELHEITSEGGGDWLAVSGVRNRLLASGRLDWMPPRGCANDRGPETRLAGPPIPSRSSRSLHSQAHEKALVHFRLLIRIIPLNGRMLSALQFALSPVWKVPEAARW